MSARRPALTDAERVDWLRLIRVDGIGPISFKGLVERHGSVAAVIDALPDIARRSGKQLKLPSPAQIAREIEAVHRNGARFIALGEPDYPRSLAAIDDAPPLLTIQGVATALAHPMVAIVGARNASALGQRFAAKLASDIADAGYTVVSGLARGIDGAAHAASLQHGTVAVVAGGIGKVYPPQHERLARELVENGCILSEMPLDWTATARDFPRRNRIVSGLSLGVVIIEAAMKSGSLITARLALEQGREVLAVPGFPLDPRNDGCNQLIRQGAVLVRHASDVLEALAPLVEQAPPTTLPRKRTGQPAFDFAAAVPDDEPQPVSSGDADQDRLVAVLGPSPVAMDDLVRASGLEPRKVQLVLLDLDLAGRIERHGNGMVSLL